MMPPEVITKLLSLINTVLSACGQSHWLQKHGNGFVLLGIGISSLISFTVANGIANAAAGGADFVYFIIAAVMAVLTIVLIALFKPVKNKEAAARRADFGLWIVDFGL